jgi:hypothetical protein
MVGFEICINRTCSGSGMWITTISDTQIECLFKCNVLVKAMLLPIKGILVLAKVF